MPEVNRSLLNMTLNVAIRKLRQELEDGRQQPAGDDGYPRSVCTSCSTGCSPTLSRSAFYHYLEGLVRAGLGKRLMFGSDQMRWPEVIGRAVAAIEEAEFLSEEQKGDIFYNNAARFLRLGKER